MALSHYPPVVCGASHRGPSPLLDQWRSMHGRNVSTLPSSEPKPLGTPRDVSPPAAAFLRALCDPTRRRIFLALMAGETCNCELSDALGLPQNLVSHHVRKLRKAGFVKEHPDPHDGRWVHIELDLAYLKKAWESLEGAFNPALLGERIPACRFRAHEKSSHRRRRLPA